MVRDIALAASGLLESASWAARASIRRRRISCSSRRPATVPSPGRTSTGTDRYRRALYTFRYRSVPYPVLQTFDAPNGDFSCVRRAALEHAAAGAGRRSTSRSSWNVPGRWHCRTLAEGGSTDAERLDLCLPPLRRAARRPTGSGRRLLRLLTRQNERFAAGWLNPWQIWLPRDPAQPPPTARRGRRPAELAAWTAVSRVLLNLDETITKE